MNDSSFMGMLIGGIGALLGLVATVIAIWSSTAGRRFPPLPEVLAKNYATKEELRDAIEAIRTRCTEERTSRAMIYQKIETQKTEMNANFQLIERTLGRLEQGMADVRERL